MTDYKDSIIGFFFLSGMFFWGCICAGFIYSIGKELFLIGKDGIE
jgi:hypothetical protein